MDIRKFLLSDQFSFLNYYFEIFIDSQEGEKIIQRGLCVLHLFSLSGNIFYILQNQEIDLSTTYRPQSQFTCFMCACLCVCVVLCDVIIWIDLSITVMLCNATTWIDMCNYHSRKDTAPQGFPGYP